MTSVTTSSSNKHQARASLLGGESAYQPLTAASSFASQQPPIYNPPANRLPYEAGGYHDRQGLPTRDLGSSAGGKGSHGMYIPSTKWTWAFMVIVLVQAIASLALESYVFGEFQANLDVRSDRNDANGDSAKEPTRTIPTYLALFIFGFVYELVLAWDALRLKNTIQIIGICLYNLGMLIYSAVQMDQVKQAVYELLGTGDIERDTWLRLRPFLIAAPCVIALGTVLLSFVAWKLYNEFAWTIYKHISADLRLKRRYLTYQIYIALLKFDFFFFLGFTVQFIVVVTKDTSDSEFALTIAAIPITIVLLLLAAWFTRREFYVGQVAIIVVYFAAMAYFVFKLVRMYTKPREDDYRAARNMLTTFAVLTLLLLVVTITTAVACMINFNKGLKQHVQRRRVPNANEVDDGKWVDESAPHQLGQVPQRMTID